MSYLDFFRTHAGLTEERVLFEAKDFLDLSKPTGGYATPYDKVARWFLANPTETTLFVKDPNRLLNLKDADMVAAAMKARFDGGNVTADYEIYADGPDIFGGSWAMRLHQAKVDGEERFSETTPFKFKIEPVQGKTSRGWKVTISYPVEAAREAGVKAMEARAAELAKQGKFPEGPLTGSGAYSNFIPKALYDKYLKMGQKQRAESVDVEEYVRRVRDVRVRLESSKTVSPADAVVKALDGKKTVGGKLKHAESVDRYGAASDDPIQVSFYTPEGDTLDGDDYDYDDIVAAYNQYAKTLEQEARKLLAKAKVTGWDAVYITNGYLVIGKE